MSDLWRRSYTLRSQSMSRESVLQKCHRYPITKNAKRAALATKSSLEGGARLF